MNDRADRFARALLRLEDELDWEALGEHYCWEGGGGFFPRKQVEAIRETGLVIAGALAEALEWLGREGPARSLYLGVGVAELVPILCEHLVLRREVVAVSLPGGESDELNRALAATEEDLGEPLPRIATEGPEPLPGSFDHGWLVSVLDDPEAFPALHDELYGRRGTSLATGRGVLEEDRLRALELAGTFLSKLDDRALLSTTDEEWPILAPLLERHRWTARCVGPALLTAVVGDPLRFHRLQR